MKYFLGKLLLFILPIGLFMLSTLFPLINSGEFFEELDEEILEDDPYLIGYVYNEQSYAYLKWKTLQSKAPQSVVSLGSSRVLQFRENMFEAPFYNAGFTIQSIRDFIPFLKGLPDKKYPEYLIIGLDQWMFNSNWDKEIVKKNIDYWSSSFDEVPTKSELKSAWKDVFRNKYEMLLPTQPDSIKLIGLNAYVNQKGMRNDGSMLYSPEIKKLMTNDSTANDYEFKSTLERIRKNFGAFQTGTEVSAEAIEELENILLFCQANDIHLIAFLPPYADAVNREFEELKGYGFIKEIYPKANSIFKFYNAEIYDFSELSKFEGKDDEMIDGFHGGEVIYLRMLIKMLEEGSKLNKVVNIEALKKDFKRRRNDYLVY